MKFSFATAFLTLTAVSAVFAAPAQDESAARAVGILHFERFGIKGTVGPRSIVGASRHEFREPVAVHALYHYEELRELDGPFKANFEHGNVFIKYFESGAQIVGKTESDLRVEFEGITKVL